MISNDDSAEFLPSIRRSPPPGDTHPLLQPLAAAQDAVARLEASVAAASPAVAEGLRARIAHREAAGWLAHGHVWIHPRDLALRDAGLTGSYAAASLAGQLDAALPTMTVHGSPPDAVPADDVISAALRLARVWRRLAEHRTWRPIANAAALRQTLGSLGWPVIVDDAGIEDWLASVLRHDEGPVLIRAGRGGRDWINRQGHPEPLAMDGLFLAACIWRDGGFGRNIPLPFWSAPAQLHHRLALRIGTEWLASFLACVTATARAARDELARLQLAEAAGATLAPPARTCPRRSIACCGAPSSPPAASPTSSRSRRRRPSACFASLIAAGAVREATGRAALAGLHHP